jgi:hypothetical protein
MAHFENLSGRYWYRFCIISNLLFETYRVIQIHISLLLVSNSLPVELFDGEFESV